ncbi:MAG: hemolysin III family protein [Saprospiraceae bacterium]|nr:hemolysin III family protein [Saprospiraceae bacterium]
MKRHHEIEEVLNSLSHGLSALTAVAGFVVLLVFATYSDKDWSLFSTFFYGIGLIAVFTSSAIYHGVSQEKTKKFWRLIDHTCIYLLIAGSYTPILLVAIGGTWGWTFFGIQWGLAIIGIFLKIFYIHKFQMTAVVMYAAMGWMILLKIGYLYANLPTTGFWLLLSGGLAYTVGIIFYAIDKRMPYAHFIWHLFVIGGALLHFLLISWYLV